MSRSSCAILPLRAAQSFSRISVGKIHLSFSRVLCGSHGFVTASRVRTQQPISRRSLGVQLDILLLHPCFNTFSRGFLVASQRNIQDGDFSLLALCSMAFLIVTNGIFSPLCRRFTLTVPVCPSPAHRCESNERNTAPYRFTEHSFWLCHFGICECPILCHSGIVWRFISSRTMPKRHNQ